MSAFDAAAHDWAAFTAFAAVLLAAGEVPLLPEGGAADYSAGTPIYDDLVDLFNSPELAA